MIGASDTVQVLGCEGAGPRWHSPGQTQVEADDLGLGVLFGRLLDAVVIARLSTGRIVQWNLAAEKLFGFTAQQAIGQSIEILMPEPIARIHRLGWERYLRTGHGLIMDAGGPVEMPARLKGGEEIRVELALSELRNAAGERFALAVIRDATHRKQLELMNLELVQARVTRSEVEAALAERDQLLDGLEVLLRIHAADADLADVVSALAEIRRLHRGELQIRVVDSDLVDLIHAACDAARRRMGGRRLVVHTPPSAPATFDPARMRQALDRVLDELIRCTGDEARIEARVTVLSPQVVQLTLNLDAVGDDRPYGVGVLLSRALLQRQGGTLTSALSTGGSLEVVITVPGNPHPTRRRRKTTRAASANSY